MKIACVDKSAADRVKLQALLEDAYESCRQSVGYISLAQLVPLSKDELLLNSAPGVVVVGPGYNIEEAYAVCRDLRQKLPADVAVISILSPESFSLRALRRFERVCNEVFSTEERAIRIVHTLSALDRSRARTNQGRLVVVSGVKGGVGATSVVSALAHAAEAGGRSSIVIDLSPNGALIQYMGAERWQSPDFAALLADNLVPDEALIKRCIVRSPNGVHLLLPPSGGHEVRELWLRDAHRFELTLSVIDLLKEQYDLVLVDTARAEGVLDFALHTRADVRLLVTSNDPASVHLLNRTLTTLLETPGAGETQILLNELAERSLDREDVLDFLYLNEAFEEEMLQLPALPFDPRGRQWIGTGNTFYTEASRATQDILDRVLRSLMDPGQTQPVVAPRRLSMAQRLTSSLARLAGRIRPAEPGIALALPRPSDGLRLSAVDNVPTRAGDDGRWAMGDTVEEGATPPNGTRREVRRAMPASRILYESPSLVVNERE